METFRKEVDGINYKGKDGTMPFRTKKNFDLLEQIYEYKTRGLTYAQISKTTGISLSHVKKCYGRYLWFKRKILNKVIEKKDITAFVDVLEETKYLKKLAYMGELKSQKGSNQHIGYIRLIADLIGMYVKLVANLGLSDSFRNSIGYKDDASFEAYIREIEQERGITEIYAETEHSDQRAPSLNVATQVASYEQEEQDKKQKEMDNVRKELEREQQENKKPFLSLISHDTEKPKDAD